MLRRNRSAIIESIVLFKKNAVKNNRYLAIETINPAPSYDAQYGVQWQIYSSLGVLGLSLLLTGIWMVFTAQFVRKKEFQLYVTHVDNEFKGMSKSFDNEIKGLTKDFDTRLDRVNLQLVEIASKLQSHVEISAVNNESMGSLINQTRVTLETKLDSLSSQIESSPASRAMLEQKLNGYGAMLREILTESQKHTYKISDGSHENLG
jgi:hypothetical protein